MLQGGKIRVRFGKEARGGAAAVTVGCDEECDASGNVTGTKNTSMRTSKSCGVVTGKGVRNNIACVGRKIDNCEPLVVNGSQVGLKAGRSTQDRSGQEGWFSSLYFPLLTFLPLSLQKKKRRACLSPICSPAWFASETPHLANKAFTADDICQRTREIRL